MTQPDTIERQLYSVQEFCRRNSIGHTTFYELVKAKAIQPVKVGVRTLIPAWSERAWHESLSSKSCIHTPIHTLGVDTGKRKRTRADGSGHKSSAKIRV